jgi:hypothetical protein
MTPDADPSQAMASAPLPAAVPVPAETQKLRGKALAHRILARAAFWSPVFAALVLFAQVALLGLRPAVSESRRLADAEVMLVERHERAVAENNAVSAQLLARQDPIFRERQRRMRLIEPFLVPETAPANGEK